MKGFLIYFFGHGVSCRWATPRLTLCQAAASNCFSPGSLARYDRELSSLAEARFEAPSRRHLSHLSRLSSKPRVNRQAGGSVRKSNYRDRAPRLPHLAR